MLSDEWFNDGKGLTRTWCTYHPSASERIHDIHPSLAEFSLVIVPHRYVHTVLVLHFLLHLLEALVLEVETVFEQTILQVLGDIV